jgi:hypothetical protein
MLSARFKVTRVVPMGADNPADAYATEVEMTPDYVGGDENTGWAEATPSGVVRLLITEKSALDEFPTGSVHDIQFHRLEET